MEEAGVILNIHGEEHGLKGEAYFSQQSNAEDYFYRERMPQLLEKFPELKVVCEHITTKTAADFVSSSPQTVAATITPQHLLYTVADLLQGLKYHLYCLPLVKFETDRQALLEAALSGAAKFFAGTDSAPHTEKATHCGCAAGCFTGGIAPQLYAKAFDLNESNFDNFQNFLSMNGSRFYELDISNETFWLEKNPHQNKIIKTASGDIIPLNIGMGENTLDWSLTL
jgi:dihydroorotase